MARSLSKAIHYLGHSVIVITPFYEKIIAPESYNLKIIAKSFPINIDEKNTLEVDFWEGELTKGLPIYFIGNAKFFARHTALYGSEHENARFLLFDIAAIKLLRTISFKADIIHCHDWHAGLIPYYLKKRYGHNPFYTKIASVFTIHNLVYQLGHDWWKISSDQKDDGRSTLPLFNDPKLENINFAKRAILNADVINAVSEQYAQEILTAKFGEDLHRILKNRTDRVFGIINGIDYNDYNPSNDPGLFRRYTADHIENKKYNKTFLQKKFQLPVSEQIPVIGMTSRIVEQKGIDLLMHIMETLMRLELQIIIMGDGDSKYIKFLQKTQKKYPKKLVYIPFDQKIETSIYAGANMFLLPSRFEPCGINQLIGLRYGCIPIVRHIGGLADTVTNFNPKTEKGNGFVFRSYDPHDMLTAITRALETYKHEDVWKKLVKHGMEQSVSWKIQAQKYVALFRKGIGNHKKGL